MKKVFNFIVLILAISVFVSCVCDGIEEPDCQERYVATEVSLADDMAGTKSVFVGDDSEITSLTLFAFDKNGKILVYDYSSGSSYSGKNIEYYSEKGEGITWMLPTRAEFDVYAVANMGDMRGRYSTLQQLLSSEDMIWSSSSLAGLSSGIPMGGVLESMKGGASFVIPMKRVVARYELSLKGFEDSGYTYRLVDFSVRNANRSVSVFGTSDYAGDGEVMDQMEHATKEDIETLNSGGKVCFYVPENMQTANGRYDLQGETIQEWYRVGEALDKKYGTSGNGADSECTFIEIEVEVVSKTNGESEIVSKALFLGSDFKTNFDVQRNKSKSITLNIDFGDTEPGINNYAAVLSNTHHEDFKLTWSECPLVTVYFNKNMEEFHGNVSLVCNDDVTGEPLMTFTKVSQINGETSSTAQFKSTCVKIGNGTLKLIGSNGTEVVLKKGISVGPAKLVFSSSATGYTSSEVNSVFDLGTTYVNKLSSFYIYAADYEGRNLKDQTTQSNVDYTLWKDKIRLEFFDTIPLYQQIIYDVSGKSAALAAAHLSVENDGTDPDRNRELSEKLTGVSQRRELKVYDETQPTAVTYTIQASLAAEPITITLWSGNNIGTDSELAFSMENTSNLPVKIKGMQFNTIESGYNMSGSDLVAGTLAASKSGYQLHRVDYTGLNGWSSRPDYPMIISDLGEVSLGLEQGMQYVTISSQPYWKIGDGYPTTEDVNNFIMAMSRKQGYLLLRFEAEMYYNCPVGAEPELLFKSKVKTGTDIYDKDNYGLTEVQLFYNGSLHSSSYSPSEDFYFGDVYHDNVQIIAENNSESYPEIEFYLDDSYNLMAKASKSVTAESLAMFIKLDSHIRCMGMTDITGTDRCGYFKSSIFDGSGVSNWEFSTLGSTVDLQYQLGDAFTDMRNEEYYSGEDKGYDSWGNKDISQFRVDRGSDYREYLKPTYVELDIRFRFTQPVIVNMTMPAIVYSYKKGPKVEWAWGGLGNNKWYGWPSCYPKHTCGDCVSDPSVFDEEDITFTDYYIINLNDIVFYLK